MTVVANLRWRVPATSTTAAAAAIGPAGRSATWIEGVLGDGIAAEFTITHGLGTRNVGVEIIENAPPYRTRLADVRRPTDDAVTIVFGTPPTANQYRYILHGPPGAAGQ
jgi:hypothetical protein